MTDDGVELARRQLLDLVQVADGAVELLEEWTNVNGNIAFTISLDTSGLKRGPNGIAVRARERFKVVIPDEFPFEHPWVFSVHKRWARTPHVQWGSYLCLYAAAAVEWNPSDGIRGFIGNRPLAATGVEDARVSRAVGGVRRRDALVREPVEINQTNRPVQEEQKTPCIRTEPAVGQQGLRRPFGNRGVKAEQDAFLGKVQTEQQRCPIVTDSEKFCAVGVETDIVKGAPLKAGRKLEVSAPQIPDALQSFVSTQCNAPSVRTDRPVAESWFHPDGW